MVSSISSRSPGYCASCKNIVENCKQSTTSMKIAIKSDRARALYLSSAWKWVNCKMPADRLCYCSRTCGGPDGPGKLMSYSNFRRHTVRSQAQPSAAFDNFVASFPCASASSQPGASGNLPTVSPVYSIQQQDLQMAQNDPENTSSEEVHYF